MTVHEAPLDHIVQCYLACEAWIAGNAPSGKLPTSAELLTQLSPTDRIHPAIAEYDNAAVLDWTHAGLDRVTEAIQGTPTSVIVNGEDSTAGHQVSTLEQKAGASVRHGPR
ncbi:hypothetical protein AB0E01_32435 [Nocardia vinacea]|uniref:hypothetical protein n=1 Tax=Nocardia vinacea TaxID=96468 RepID=UPI0033E94B63